MMAPELQAFMLTSFWLVAWACGLVAMVCIVVGFVVSTWRLFVSER